MELLHGAVKVREGKKWKQRWVVLRSKKSCRESYYYLFLYKDEAHAAKDGKEKNTIPLTDFCGLEFCRHYDKEANILIVVTSSQTVYLAFGTLEVRDEWKRTFVEHLGEGSTFKICIPDKQRMKAGDATIRLYSTFVSIITNNNYKCLNRWHLNDIQRYSAIDSDHFMFELTSSVKTKGGHVINLLVNDNSEDIAKAFDVVTADSRNNCTLARHGSAMLDELGQAKRNAGDQNFFRRAILRASERMRKKKRRNTAGPTMTSKNKTQCTTTAAAAATNASTTQQQDNFSSLDRKKNPQISVDLDDESLRKTMQIATTQDSPEQAVTMTSSSSKVKVKKSSSTISNLPRTSNNEQQRLGSDNLDSPLLRDSGSDDAFVDAESTGGGNSSLPTTPNDVDIKPKTFSKMDETDGKRSLSGMNIASVETTDKSDISVRNSRRSVDSFLSYKNPAKYAIAKTKGTNPKTKNEKTPTPPPRSPVSLGLDPCVFQFPPAEDMENVIESLNEQEADKESVGNSEPDSPAFMNNLNQTVVNTSDYFDTSSLPMPPKSLPSQGTATMVNTSDYYDTSSLATPPTAPPHLNLKGNSFTHVNTGDYYDTSSLVMPPTAPPSKMNATTVNAGDYYDTSSLTIPASASKVNTNNPASWTSYDADVSLRNDAYQNLPNFNNKKTNNDSSMYNVDYTETSNLAFRRNQKSDPLDAEHWTKVTGDGKIGGAAVPSPDLHPTLDYVNIESDEDNSYVNVTSQCTIIPHGGGGDHLQPKRNKPKPPRLKNEFIKPELKNDFAKYDDDDQSIYHAVGALDEGSYENVNGVRRSNNTGDYLNVNKRLSPNNVDTSKLNYIELGLPPDNSHKTNCTSPITKSSSSSYTSDYTRIDVDATGAINRSMVEHRQLRENQPLRTPPRFSR